MIPIQLTTQAASKNINSTHDLSEKHGFLSRLMIQLWVVPMSAKKQRFLSFDLP